MSEIRITLVLRTCPRCTTHWHWQGSRGSLPLFGDLASYDITVVLANELEGGTGSGERLLSPLLPREVVVTIAALLQREPAERMTLTAAMNAFSGQSPGYYGVI